MTPQEIRWEEFDSKSQQYSPEKVTRKESQKKKNEHQKKNKKQNKTWRVDDTTTMIIFWNQHEVLLNVKHPTYLDRDCRINNLNLIAEALREHGISFSTEEISSKMHSLRVYFSTQRNKLILSKPSGAGTKDVHKVNWPFYEPLIFLNGNLVSR